MKKIFEVVVVGEDPKELVDFIREKAFKDKPQSVNVLIQEVDKKHRYTSEDDDLFCMRLHIRISKDSSEAFIAGFNTMFAFWDKIQESDDKNWWTFDPKGSLLSVVEAYLSNLKSFMLRMKRLNYNGTMEIRLEPYIPRYSSNTNASIEDVYQRMLDKHITLLKWTNIDKWYNYN